MSGADRAAAAVRRANARDCLLSLRDTGVPMTVGELALHTGLSRPTVDAVLAELIKHGTVQPTARSESSAPGRPARRFVFEPTTTLVAGIDVGARSIRCTLSDAAGTVLVRSVVPSSPQQCPDRLEAIVRIVQDAVDRARSTLLSGPGDDDAPAPAGRHAGADDRDQPIGLVPGHAVSSAEADADDDAADDDAADDDYDDDAEDTDDAEDIDDSGSERAEAPPRQPRLAAVGLALPAVLDHQDRVIQSLTIPEWVGVDIKAELGQRLGCAVSIENDIKLASFAEHHLGDAVDSLVYLQIGNRISVSVIIDGKILQGSHRLAGELGTQRGMRWTETSQRGQLQWSTGTEAEPLFDRAAAGDDQAQQEISLFCAEIAPKITALLLAIDPEQLIVGGGLSRAGETLLDPLRRHIHHLLTSDDKPELIAARLTSEGAVTGALGHTFEHSSTEIFGIAGVPAPWARLRIESKPSSNQENRT